MTAVLFFTTKFLNDKEGSKVIMMTIFKAIRVKERTHESRKLMLVPERKRVTSGFLQEEKMSRLVFP